MSSLREKRTSPDLQKFTRLELRPFSVNCLYFELKGGLCGQKGTKPLLETHTHEGNLTLFNTYFY